MPYSEYFLRLDAIRPEETERILTGVDDFFASDTEVGSQAQELSPIQAHIASIAQSIAWSHRYDSPEEQHLHLVAWQRQLTDTLNTVEAFKLRDAGEFNSDAWQELFAREGTWGMYFGLLSILGKPDDMSGFGGFTSTVQIPRPFLPEFITLQSNTGEARVKVAARPSDSHDIHASLRRKDDVLLVRPRADYDTAYSDPSIQKIFTGRDGEVAITAPGRMVFVVDTTTTNLSEPRVSLRQALQLPLVNNGVQSVYVTNIFPFSGIVPTTFEPQGENILELTPLQLARLNTVFDIQQRFGPQDK